MTHLRKLTAVLLAVIMVFALAACGQKDDTAAVDKDLTVNVVALNGTTGFGMAKLMSDSKAGTTALSYNFTVETDPSNATAALVNGTADIAALPTNAAAALYIAGMAPDYRKAAGMARQALASGAAFRKLEELRAFQGKEELCPA